MSEDRQCDLSLCSVHFTLCAVTQQVLLLIVSRHFRNHQDSAADVMSIFTLALKQASLGKVFPLLFHIIAIMNST